MIYTLRYDHRRIKYSFFIELKSRVYKCCQIIHCLLKAVAREGLSYTTQKDIS